MQRLCRLLLPLGLALTVVFGCGGNGTNPGPGPAADVILSPTSLSLTRGDVVQIGSQVVDADDNQVFGETLTLPSSNSNMVTVSPNGLVCAGIWDANFVVCNTRDSAGALLPLGTANITAATNSGVTSDPLPVSVHERVDSIVVTPIGVPPVCTSVGATAPANTQKFQAVAYSNNAEACARQTPPATAPCELPTSTLGTFTFTSAPATVATLAADSPALGYTTVATAKGPGIANISASLLGASSLPATFSVCAPKSLSIHVKSSTDTSFSIATAATKELAADVLDVNDIAIPNPPVSWSSSNRAAASVNTTGVVTGVNPGVTQITAACSPPSCNAGRSESVFSNIVTGTITGTATTTTVYVTSKTAATNKIYPIDTSNHTVGTAIDFPTNFDNPNSITPNSGGNRVFIGTEDGLLVLDTTTNATPTGHTSAAGRILTFDPSGTLVVLRDATATDEVLIFNGSTGFTSTLTVADPVAAAFTPDGDKLYIATGPGGSNRVFVFSTETLFTSLDMGSPQTDVVTSITGNYAFLADPGIDTIESCSNTLLGALSGITPVALKATAKPVTGDSRRYQLIAVVPPNVRQFDIQDVVGSPCPGLPNVTGGTVDKSFTGVAAFNPVQVLATPDGSKVVILTDTNKILVYNVGTDETAGTTSVIDLAGSATAARSGGITLDGTRLYVGVVGANEVQVFNLTTGTLVTQVAVPVAPDLVAVRPK